MINFSFRFQNNKSDKYIVLGLLGLFAPMILSIILIEAFNLNYSKFSIVIIIAGILGVGCLILGILKFIAHAKSTDSIVLKSDRIESAFHGTIYFSEIESISGFGPLGAPPPSMKIRLHSGKKTVWYLNPTKTKYNDEEDAEIFKAFTVALGDRLAIFERKEASQKTLTEKKYNEPVETPYPTDSDQDTQELSQQVKEVVNKHNRGVWTIPFGLLFALLLFFRTCGGDYFKDKRQRELQEIFTNNDQYYDQLLDESKEVIAKYVRQLGPVYVFSNDAEVQVKLLPNISENTTLTNIPSLYKSNQIQPLKNFIKNPDSTEFLTVLLLPNDDLQIMSKSNFNYSDSAQSWLYLRFADHALDQTEALNTDSISFKPFYFNTGIPINKEQSIEESLKKSVPGLRMMLAQVKHRKTMKMYLTAAEKDGVSKDLFHQVKQELQLLLHEVGVDTARFQTQVFDPTK